MTDLAIITGIRDRVRTGDAAFIFDEDLVEALGAADRLGDTDVDDIRRLSEDRARTDREAREQCVRNLEEARQELSDYRCTAVMLTRRLRTIEETISDLEERVADYEAWLS